MASNRNKYMREFRSEKKTFSVLLEKKIVEDLEDVLAKKNESKKQFLLRNIEEEMNKSIDNDKIRSF
jgi:hypothetical protein